MALAQFKAWLIDRHPAIFGLLADLRETLPGGSDDEAELRLLPALCEPDRLAIDVGANYGAYSYPMLGHAGGVLAIEPNPAMLAVLRHRFRHAVAAGRMRIEACAIGEADGAATLEVPVEAPALASVTASGHHPPGHLVRHEVTMRCLDGLVDRPVAFIKIDVEGHEGAVLRGARGLIRRDRPSLLIEAEDRHHLGSPAEIRRLLEAEGYAGYFLADGRLCPIARFSPEQHQRRDALNAAGTARLPGTTYINNFLYFGRPEATARASALLAAD